MNELVKQITDLVRSQGLLMKSARQIENNSDNIKVKPGDANFVTVYDEAVQNNLIKGLKEILPNALFFAEEKDNSSVDTTRGHCFIIDPIDGTTNFIHDMGASAISVGLFLDGKPYIGVIYDPYRDEMFYAQTGFGAFLNGTRINCSDRTLDKALFSFGSAPYNKSTLGSEAFSLAQKLFYKTADIRRSGSAAIDIACVACGRTDAFFEPVLSPWDYAAGITILTEASAAVSDFNGNNLSLSIPSSFLCSNRVIYRELLNLIQEED